MRIPACEIMLNTRHIADLIERGEVQGIKDAMEQSLAPGSQTFEQDLVRLYRKATITFDEAMANADSPTNLSWLINNSQLTASAGQPESQAAPTAAPTSDGGASFSGFKLDLADHD
jgi:twitching motility protein PilU